MINFNTSIDELRQFILDNGEESNWNYTPNLLVKDILIKLQYGKYKVVLMRYYKGSRSFYYSDERDEWNNIDCIEGWFPITI